MQTMQVSTGIWYFQVQSAVLKTGYIWSRMVGAQRVETFVSTANNALWFDGATTLQPQTVPVSFTTRDDFLAWACQELGAEKGIHWWETTADVEKGDWACGKVPGPKVPISAL